MEEFIVKLFLKKIQIKQTMKSFSKIEQTIICKLVDEKLCCRPVLLGNVLNTLFKDCFIKVDKQNSIVQIMFSGDSNDTIIDTQTKMAEIILLLGYLNHNGLLCLFNCASTNTPPYTIGQGSQNRCTIPYDFPDHTISDWLLDNCNKQIIVSYDLVWLKEHNFIAKEESRFRRQQIATWTGIIVSFLIGCSGLILNIL